MRKEEGYIKKAIDDSVALRKLFFEQSMDKILQLYDFLQRARKAGKQVFLFGNGGSAADAQHFASELVHRVESGKIGMRAMALHTDSSLMTAMANDEGFEQVFARQLEIFAAAGDIAIAISTSGNSANVVQGLETARQKECITAGLLGRKGGRALDYCDLAIVVPHSSTPRIQEVHGMIIHLICELLENYK